MSEQQENLNASLEDTEDTDAEYDGDLGDGARTKGTSPGIIGINPT